MADNGMQKNVVIRRAEPNPWAASLFGLAFLTLLSEGLYLACGVVIYACASAERLCNTPVAAFAKPLIGSSQATDGTTSLYINYSIGLPGLSNGFYLVYGLFDASNRTQFYQTIAISFVAGWLAIFVCMKLSAGRGMLGRLVIAAVCAIGWFVIYNGAEQSIFPGDFNSMFVNRAAEIPIATVSLLVVSLIAERFRARS